jgi:hypothetical protein
MPVARVQTSARNTATLYPVVPRADVPTLIKDTAGGVGDVGVGVGFAGGTLVIYNVIPATAIITMRAMITA